MILDPRCVTTYVQLMRTCGALLSNPQTVLFTPTVQKHYDVLVLCHRYDYYDSFFVLLSVLNWNNTIILCTRTDHRWLYFELKPWSLWWQLIFTHTLYSSAHIKDKCCLTYNYFLLITIYYIHKICISHPYLWTLNLIFDSHIEIPYDRVNRKAIK